MYHVMNRGDQREDIFRDDQDRQRFLSTLGEACGKTEWQVHAYCLMRNHFHLVLESPQPNLVFGMKWLLGVLLEKRRAEEGAADYEELGRDWALGSEEFRRELLAGVEGQVGAHHYGAERQETGAQKAERIVREELNCSSSWRAGFTFQTP
jgi:REP element-mobilizing transposase RayT